MLNRLNTKEREHLGKVKALPCSVCDAPGPSHAHHVKQGQQYTAVAGLSPLARGNHLGFTMARAGLGPIPARTGQPRTHQ